MFLKRMKFSLASQITPSLRAGQHNVIINLKYFNHERISKTVHGINNVGFIISSRIMTKYNCKDATLIVRNRLYVCYIYYISEYVLPMSFVYCLCPGCAAGDE